MMSRMAKRIGPLSQDPWNIGLVVIAVAALVFAGYAGVVSLSRDDSTDYVSVDVPEEASSGLLEVPRPSVRPLVVTTLGDSLTDSWGATTIEQGFAPQLIRQWSEGGPVDSNVTAIAGAPLREVAEAAAVIPPSDLVIIELGTNDNGDRKTPRVDFKAQYTDLIARVRASTPDAALVCLSTWRNSADGSALNAIIRDVCQGDRTKFLTVTDIYSRPESRGPQGRTDYIGDPGGGDNFHPNDAGHTAIKDRIADNVEFVTDSAA